jgi:hypothetical protein
MAEISLDRLEKATGFIRNLVIVFGALIPAAFFVHKELGEPIRVDLVTMGIHGSRIAVIERDVAKGVLVQTDRNKSPSSNLSSTALAQQAGRLDMIAKIDVHNNSKVATDLRLILRNPRATYAELPSPTDQHWDPLPRRQFLIVDPETSCSVDESLLKFKDDNVLTADEVGILHIRDFPADCMISVQVAVVRSDEVYLEVHANGRTYYPRRAGIIYGKLGHYASLIQERGAPGYLLLIIMPIAAIVLVCLYAVKLIARISGGASSSEINDI